MFMLTIGIFLVIAGFVISKSPFNIARYATTFKLAGMAVAILGILSSGIRQIDAGTIGVQSLFGKVSPQVLENGLNFINPLAEVAVFDTKTQNYTMSATTHEGELQGDDAIRVLSADGLEVVIDLTVLYKIMPDKAPAIFKGIGTDYKDKIVRPVTRTRIRDNAVYYDAVALYSKRRDEFQNRIYQTIDKDFRSRGLILEQLLIRNINLPESVKKQLNPKSMRSRMHKKWNSCSRKKNRRRNVSASKHVVSPIIRRSLRSA